MNVIENVNNLRPHIIWVHPQTFTYTCTHTTHNLKTPQTTFLHVFYIALPRMAEATCEKCDKYYEDPRMLPCLHSFCLGCLQKELDTHATLNCPNCKEQVILPENGLSGLPQDLRKANEAELEHIREKVEEADEQCEICGRTDSTGKAVAYCIECKEYLCKFCEGRHGKRENTAQHNLFMMGQRLVKTNEATPATRFFQKELPCPRHKGQPIQAYCMKCEKMVCLSCVSFEHRDHQEECKYLEDIAKQEMESLMASKSNAQHALASLDSAIAQCKETMEQVEKRKKAVDSEIDNSLKQVRMALLTQSENIRLKKIRGLQVQVQGLQKVRDGIYLASAMIDDAQSHSPAQQLSTKKVLAQRATKFQKEFEASVLLPSQGANFVTDISDPATISKMISLGCVSGEGYPPNSTCDAGYVPRGVVGKPRTIKVVAVDKGGKEVRTGGDEVAAKLVRKGSGDPGVNGSTTDNGDGTYTVSVTPQSDGEHELHVTLANGHVKCSPFKYAVANPRSTPYTSMSAQHRFGTKMNPFDVAMTVDGNLAVAEHGNQTVTLYSATGQSIDSFGTAGSYGSGDGQFKSPSAVAVRGDLLYVCDRGNSRVQKFSISRRSFISKFGHSGEGQLSNPRGICTDPEGKVYVADYGKHLIHVFNGDDSFAYSFPCQQHPWGMAFDHQGRLHIAAYGSNCIRVFTPQGEQLTSYGTGTLNRPTGIAIEGAGYTAISENGGNNRLWIFSPDHTLVHTLSGQFSSGLGIACDLEGNFWVADCNNNRLVKY